ncbi:centromere protein T isoform X2 [Apodemus sylvaticus]|uniref:centromere protein T isoform X2 n=1 Tax=Apodemus sylvaticus TaxID=10129 RepID=UPI002243556B|nr:centromere protein T isoform X2 [Apodemus sylvaticus]
MADLSSPDGDPTVRTLLRRVLDTADSRTPRRRWSTQTNAQRRQSQTPYSKRQGSQTKTGARKHSYGARSGGRLARVQGHGHLEEQTPRTLLKNILLTAPESSTVMPDPMVKPAQVPEVALSSRRESSRGSLELHLPELERPSTLAPGLTAPGKRKQKLRLSVFQQEVNQGLPVSQEPRGNADVPSIASSFSLSFVSPRLPPTVERPGLARRRPIRRLVNVSALLQDLEDKSLTSTPPGDDHRTPVAGLPKHVVLEDTQPFSQPVADSSLSVNHSLPKPSHTGVEDAESAVGPRTPSTGTRLQNQMSTTGFGASPLPFVEPKDREESSEDEEISGRPASGELSSGTYTLLPTEQPHQLSERPTSPEQPHQLSERPTSPGQPHQLSERPTSPGQPRQLSEPPTSPGQPRQLSKRPTSPGQPHQLSERPTSPGVAVLSSEPLESVPAKLPSRTRTAGPRHRQDPYKAGLSHYVKLFSFYAKMPVEKAALERVEKCLDKYFQHLCDDLEVFAAHAGRKTVTPKDLELLMRRQGLVTDQVSLNVLVERYLPLEYRQQLIPCAFSGNSVFPAQ